MYSAYSTAGRGKTGNVIIEQYRHRFIITDDFFESGIGL